MVFMTKREFDQATKENYGAPMGGRSAYRSTRKNTRTMADDFVARRAAEMTARNTRPVDGILFTLGIASRFRAVAEYRRSMRLPLL
jgi:hypothetical protein